MNSIDKNKIDVTILSNTLIKENHSEYDSISIVWNAKNNSDKSLWLLVCKPIKINTSTPIVLDHTSDEHIWKSKINVMPSFHFLKITPDQSINYLIDYKLPKLQDEENIYIKGRFSYSFNKPNDDWVRNKNWLKVFEWQSIKNSEILDISN